MSDDDTDGRDGPRTTRLGADKDGELVAIDWPDGDVEQMLQAQVGSTPQAGSRSTPGPTSGETGPVPRVSASGNSIWGSVDLRSFSLNSTELATTLKRFRDEMYRNQFPVILPSFQQRCTNCGTEYDEERDTCEVCGNAEFSQPSREQKHWLSRFVESVNDDNQSLHSLMKYEEDHQSFYGVSTILVRLKYQHVERDVQVGGRSVQHTTRWEPTDIKELVHTNPARLYPVLDHNNRHGGWWTCPQHRGEYWSAGDLTFEDDADHPTEVCPECHARLAEVGYAEVSGQRHDDIETLFLKHEVIDWARHFPVLSGLDGRSPVMPLVKLQAILQWSRNYDLQYLNPQNDQQLPDKFLVAYGPNIQSRLRASLREEESKNPWEEGRLMFDGDAEDVEIELLDLSQSSGINGREPMVDRLMSQIRAMFGVSDAFENELSDTGGMNAEGTQVEITNSAIASAHQDTKDKALDTLCRIIERVDGHCDWELSYIDPETEDAALSPLEVLQGIEIAQQTGTKVTVEDGQLQIPDQTIGDTAAPAESEPAQAPDEDGDASSDADADSGPEPPGDDDPTAANGESPTESTDAEPTA